MINTIETRLRLDLDQESIIDSCINIWSEHYRKTWVMFNNKQLSELDIYHILSQTNLFTSTQINSLVNKVKTEHSKIKELTKSQLKNNQTKLNNINKFIIKESKTINDKLKSISTFKSKLPKLREKNNTIKLKESYSKINELSKSIEKKQLVLTQKERKANRLTKSITILQKRIDANTFKLCFGSSALLNQRPGNYSDKFRLIDSQRPYPDLTKWKFDWNLSRNNIWLSIGSKDCPQSNAEIQYYPNEKKLNLRLIDSIAINRMKDLAKETKLDIIKGKEAKVYPLRMSCRFIEIDKVEFCKKNQAKIIQAINNKQPITAKIMKKLSPNGKDIGFYLQLSFNETVIDRVKLNSKSNTIGIDLNEKGLAYCIVKSDGNRLNKTINGKKSYGFINWDLKDKSTEQREFIISNCVTELLVIAQSFGVYSIAIENLDFSSTIQSMNSGYKVNQKYNKMLTQFAKSKFQSLIKRKAERLGMTINLVNPSYSSIGGFAKYGLINKLPVDIAASLWLARQSIYGKEYKQENNVVYKKKHEETVSLPYVNQPKQSKKLTNIDKQWKDISLELGKNRTQWYKNTIKFIQSNSVSRLLSQNPFENPVVV